MNPFHRYPRDPVAHPDRPWWRLCYMMECRDSYWLRSDGLDAKVPHDAGQYTDRLAEIDREHPMPVPEPRCGQIWSNGERDFLIDVVTFDFERTVAHSACWGEWLPDNWPPEGAVLIHGPGAPWAPPPWDGPEGPSSPMETP